MKKIELKNLAEFFGGRVPAGRIQDRDVRIAIVRLYASLAAAYKPVADEIEAVRLSLVGDKTEEIARFGELQMRSMDSRLTEQEREQAATELAGMTECAQIDQDFREAVSKILKDDITVDIKKVPMEVLYEAICDCGIAKDAPLEAFANEFANVIE